MKTLPYFLTHIINVDLEKEKNDIMFDTWLHKIWDKGFIEYKKSVEKGIKKEKQVPRKMSDEEEKQNLERANKILGIKEV